MRRIVLVLALPWPSLAMAALFALPDKPAR